MLASLSKTEVHINSWSLFINKHDSWPHSHHPAFDRAKTGRWEALGMRLHAVQCTCTDYYVWLYDVSRNMSQVSCSFKNYRLILSQCSKHKWSSLNSIHQKFTASETCGFGSSYSKYVSYRSAVHHLHPASVTDVLWCIRQTEILPATLISKMCHNSY